MPELEYENIFICAVSPIWICLKSILWEIFLFGLCTVKHKMPGRAWLDDYFISSLFLYKNQNSNQPAMEQIQRNYFTEGLLDQKITYLVTV